MHRKTLKQIRAREVLTTLRRNTGFALRRLKDMKNNPENFSPEDRMRTVQDLRDSIRERNKILRDNPELAPIRARQLSFKRRLLCMNS